MLAPEEARGVRTPSRESAPALEGDKQVDWKERAQSGERVRAPGWWGEAGLEFELEDAQSAGAGGDLE